MYGNTVVIAPCACCTPLGRLSSLTLPVTEACPGYAGDGAAHGRVKSAAAVAHCAIGQRDPHRSLGLFLSAGQRTWGGSCGAWGHPPKKWVHKNAVQNEQLCHAFFAFDPISATPKRPQKQAETKDPWFHSSKYAASPVLLHRPVVPQSYSPTLPRSHSPRVPQSHSATALQSHRPTAPQPHSPTVLQSHTPTVRETVPEFPRQGNLQEYHMENVIFWENGERWGYP